MAQAQVLGHSRRPILRGDSPPLRGALSELLASEAEAHHSDSFEEDRSNAVLLPEVQKCAQPLSIGLGAIPRRLGESGWRRGSGDRVCKVASWGSWVQLNDLARLVPDRAAQVCGEWAHSPTGFLGERGGRVRPPYEELHRRARNRWRLPAQGRLGRLTHFAVMDTLSACRAPHEFLLVASCFTCPDSFQLCS
jgi:hypothetical protein